MAKSKAKEEDQGVTVKAPGLFKSEGTPGPVLLPDGGYAFSFKGVSVRPLGEEGSEPDAFSINLQLEVIDAVQEKNENQIGNMVFKSIYLVNPEGPKWEDKIKGQDRYIRDIGIDDLKSILLAAKVKMKEEDEGDVVSICNKLVGQTAVANTKIKENKKLEAGKEMRFSRWREDEDAGK